MDHKFEFGQVVATPASLDLLHQHGINPLLLLSRHVTGDWGDVCSDDAAANEDAVRTGARVLSSYQINATSMVWIITEAISNWDEKGNALIVPKRLATTILLPSEY